MVLEAINTTLLMNNWASWDFLINMSESDFPLLSLMELETHLSRLQFCLHFIGKFFLTALSLRELIAQENFRNKDRNFLSSHGYDTARFIQKQGLEYLFLQCEDRMWRIGKRCLFFQENFFLIKSLCFI